ncbi:hypothetical protein PPH41_27480, partial [Burkholderia gladioli]|nr:hypothetical protein [Burkholderia gladioli]
LSLDTLLRSEESLLSGNGGTCRLSLDTLLRSEESLLSGNGGTCRLEADEASLQLAKEAPLQLFAYVGANTGGEFFDKIAGSVFEQAVGKLGWSGAAQLQIGHDELHWPTGSEWGDAAEKTISRMSLFGSVIGTSAAAGAAIAADGYSDFHASMANNAVGGALVTALCLPFVMTLMRKARASGSSAGSANNV